MRGESTASFRRVLAAAVLLGAAGIAGSAQAGNYDMGSLASQFLQSKTEMTILSHDDQAAPDCKAKSFVKANPTVSPSIRKVGAVAERKWQEQWTLDRCGSHVNYWVFFTEVGNGGAYYSIVDPQQAEAPIKK
jgi:hypothetical protein